MDKNFARNTHRIAGKSRQAFRKQGKGAETTIQPKKEQFIQEPDRPSQPASIFIIMAMQRYSDKELFVFLWVIIPYTLLINFMCLGSCAYSSFTTALKYTGLSALYFFCGYFIFGLAGAIIQKKVPAPQDLFKRIGIMLPVFYVMNVYLILGVYLFYERLVVSACETRRDNLLWVIAFGCLASTVITFINEGAVNWSKWKNALTETEQLKNTYQKSKLFGLKGQINPHFLFNCFNTLSSLINEDEETAEHFLNEMTKVHRYMLRNDDEALVTLTEELQFARSYLQLISVRFGPAIRYNIEVPPKLYPLFLPPLSLQVILENIIYANTISKTTPLTISIKAGDDFLSITNNIQSKMMNEEGTLLEGIDNLITKYRLMSEQEVVVTEMNDERTIFLPLFTQKAMPV